MNSIINFSGKIILKSVLLQNLFLFIGSSNLRIIYYHIVSNSPPNYYFKDKTISIEDFRKQLKYFKKRYSFISLDEAVNKIKNGDSLKGQIALTTDDGFVENYTIIAPILLEEKIPATFFLINNCIDNQDLMWRNKLVYIFNKLGHKKSGELILTFAKKHNLPIPTNTENIIGWSERTFVMNEKEKLSSMLWEESNMEPLLQFLDEQKPYMTTKQIKELISGGFSIGAHTNTHPICSKLNYDTLEKEIIGSINGISKKIGVSPTHFSYPFKYRAKYEYEKKLIESNKYKVKSLIGVKNKLNNRDPYSWERDLQEADPNIAAFRFFILPVIRKIKQVFQIKK